MPLSRGQWQNKAQTIYNKFLIKHESGNLVIRVQIVKTRYNNKAYSYSIRF